MDIRKELRAAALMWYEKKYTPIPLYYGEKVPAVKWAPYVGHRPSKKSVERWWRYLYNVAVLLERGLTVVDFDESGVFESWYAEMAGETYVVSTARGYHAYFRLREPLAFSLKIEGGDLKTTGLVLTPPSMHPAGVKYKVVSQAPIMEVQGVSSLNVTLEMAELPNEPYAPKKFNGNGIITRVKNAVSILEVLQSRVNKFYSANGGYMIVCPLHDDSNPSMKVDPVNNRCMCFAPGCAGHGKWLDVIDVYSALHNIPQTDAISLLASSRGL